MVGSWIWKSNLAGLGFITQVVSFDFCLAIENFLNCWFQCILQEFIDARDADDARHYVNGKDFDGNRLIVEFARRVSIGMYFRLSIFPDAEHI